MAMNHQADIATTMKNNIGVSNQEKEDDKMSVVGNLLFVTASHNKIRSGLAFQMVDFVLLVTCFV